MLIRSYASVRVVIRTHGSMERSSRKTSTARAESLPPLQDRAGLPREGCSAEVRVVAAAMSSFPETVARTLAP